METIKLYLSTLLYERKLDCAEYIWNTYHDSLDLSLKNFIRKLIKSKEILDDIKERFPVNIPSENGSDESAESDDDEYDDETYESRLEDLQRQKKRLIDRIYLLKKKHRYTEETPQSVFGDT